MSRLVTPHTYWCHRKFISIALAVFIAISISAGATTRAQAQEVSTMTSADKSGDLPSATQGKGPGAGGTLYPRTLERSDGLKVIDRPGGKNPPGPINSSNSTNSTQVIVNSGGGGGGDGGYQYDRPDQELEPTPDPPPGRIGLEFEQLVEQSVGSPLALFGQRAFNDGSFGLTASDIAAPADYILGPGDEVSIRAWGQIDIDIRETLSREGTVFIPGVGTIPLGGIAANKIEKQLRAYISKYFRNYKLSASLAQLRAVPVYVTGNAVQRGMHRVPALSTLIHAVFSVGKPTRDGDIRRIQLHRNGKRIAQIDLYDFLLDGDKSKDITIRGGDVIHIPTIRGLVGIVGSIKRPAIFHLNKMTTLADLIDHAGGLTTAASDRRVMIERITDRTGREMIDLPINEETLRRPMGDGDLVNIVPVSPRIAKTVTLRGNVARPLRSGWHWGMRVSDLIPDAQSLMLPAYWVTRNRESGQQMMFEGRHRKDAKPKVNQINWDYATVERLDPKTLIPELIPINLGRAINDHHPNHDILLHPSDIITIYALDDFMVNQARKQRYVRIEGEIRRSGLYELRQGETLPQLVKRVGGLTEMSYLFGAELRRESVRKFQQERMKQTIQKLEHEAYRLVSKNAISTTGEDVSKALPIQLEALRSLINRLNAVKATGRITLEMSAAAKELCDLPEYPLEDGDSIFIPARPAVVSVVGAVYQEGPILHKPNRTVAEYLEIAGGPTRHAHEEPPIILRADGSIIVEQSQGWNREDSVTPMTLMPGDTIVVREDLDQIRLGKILSDWTRIVYQFGLGAASLLILRGI